MKTTPKLPRKKLCKGCPEYFRPSAEFKDCCSEDCNAKWYEQLILAGRKLRQKQAKDAYADNRKAFRDWKTADHKVQFKLTRLVAQKLANRLDANLPCICCDAPRGSAQFCGGHFKTVGAHSELALDLRNIHGQRNKTCNCENGGNPVGFKAGLIKRYGQPIVDYLESYHPPLKLTCEEMIAMRKTMNAEIRNLEQGNPPARNWRALP